MRDHPGQRLALNLQSMKTCQPVCIEGDVEVTSIHELDALQSIDNAVSTR